MIQVKGAQSQLLSGKLQELSHNGLGGGKQGICYYNKIHCNMSGLGPAVEVGQRQLLIVRGIMQAEKGKQMRAVRAKCLVN